VVVVGLSLVGGEQVRLLGCGISSLRPYWVGANHFRNCQEYYAESFIKFMPEAYLSSLMSRNVWSQFSAYILYSAIRILLQVQYCPLLHTMSGPSSIPTPFHDLSPIALDMGPPISSTHLSGVHD
jgi:hypothetical protein